MGMTSKNTKNILTLKDKIIKALKEIYDPEIPVDIYELGLIYDIEIADDASVIIRMTLTSPACPVAGSLPPEVEHKTEQVEGVTSAQVEVVWDPPWTPELMSEVARVELNMW
jgi:FeS assembly SUF system protein